MRKHTYLAAGIAAGALLTAFSIAPATADTVDELTAGGTNVAVGDAVLGRLVRPAPRDRVGGGGRDGGERERDGEHEEGALHGRTRVSR